MSRTRVKICGITRVTDAEAAVEAGVDALGFVLWKGSARSVPAGTVAGIVSGLPPYVLRVGVFVNEPAEALTTALRTARLDRAQLHGEEDDAYCAALGVDWYKVFRVGPGTEPSAVAAAVSRLGRRAFMLDTRASHTAGGTGVAFDWRIAAKIAMRAALAGRPRLILAGGLDPDNVAEAVRLVRPWAVDVSSGVEAKPGIKDPARIRAFVDAVRAAC